MIYLSVGGGNVSAEVLAPVQYVNIQGFILLSVCWGASIEVADHCKIQDNNGPEKQSFMLINVCERSLYNLLYNLSQYPQ